MNPIKQKMIPDPLNRHGKNREPSPILTELKPRSKLSSFGFSLVYHCFCLLSSCFSFPETFIQGVDVSELLSQKSSGVVYYDSEGHPADALAVLANSGVSHIRLRVWNDPFDAEGRGYGAGNINAARVAELSARAAKLGMKTLIDFHYSDFWADPSRQIEPKAWAGMSVEEKEIALAAYTRETLATILRSLCLDWDS